MIVGMGAKVSGTSMPGLRSFSIGLMPFMPAP